MPRILHITSIVELRAQESAWDDLWRRSEATMPTARAELVAQWVGQFAPQQRFHAVVVAEQGQWLAALPLVGRRMAGLLPVGKLPSNPWSAGGELLWDPSLTEADELVRGIADAGWPLLHLEGASPDAAGWRAVIAAATRSGMAVDYRPRCQVARISIAHDWEACRRSWSRKHRQQMAACMRRLAARGPVELDLRNGLAPEEVEPWLRQGFEIEDRSWKGAAGTSVLRSGEVFEFFLRQARQLARWRQLELAFLRCAGRPIAFVYGAAGKGVFHSCKIGYDPAYADYSPGQLLRYCLLERFHADPERRAMDFRGPMTESHARWRPERYEVGRLLLASEPLGRLAVAAHRILTTTNDTKDTKEEERETNCPVKTSPAIP